MSTSDKGPVLVVQWPNGLLAQNTSEQALPEQVRVIASVVDESRLAHATWRVEHGTLRDVSPAQAELDFDGEPGVVDVKVSGGAV